MKIIHIVPTYLPAVRYGGPIWSVHGLCKSLAALGNEVQVLTTNVDGQKDSNVPLNQSVDIDGVKVWYFPCPKLRRIYYSPDLSCALNSMIDHVDIIHLHSIFLWPTYIASRIAIKSAKPYILSPRGMLVKELFFRRNYLIKTLWFNFIEKKTIAHCSGLHVTSELERIELTKFAISKNKIINIPNGIDLPDNLELSKNSLVPENCQPYVLFVGRINWKKGLDCLIKAWSNISDIHLIIAGNDEDGYQEQLETLVKQLKLNKFIHFIGPLNDQSKWKMYADAELFVLPSHSENFGNVVLEAMIMECPVIVSPGVGLANVVSDCEAGLVIDNIPDLLAQGINMLMDNSDLRKEMGSNGKQKILNEFTWSIVSKKMESAYKEILE